MLNLTLGLRVGLAFGLFFQAGLFAIRLCRIKGLTPLETGCIGFGVGAGLIAFEMLCLSFTGLHWNIPLILAPWGGLWLLYALWQPSRPDLGRWRIPGRAAISQSRTLVKQLRQVRLSIPPVDALLLGALAVIVATVFFRAAFHPIVEWDAWAIYDLKARAFYHDRSIFPVVTDFFYRWTGFDYPPLVPLAGAFFYFIVGRVTAVVLLLTAAFYAATLGLFYSALRRYGGSRTVCLGLTLGLAAVPNILFWSQQLYADIFLLYFVLNCMVFVFFYFREAGRQWLWLAGLMAAFATQTKVEGIVLIGPALAALVLRALWSTGARASKWLAVGYFAALVALVYAPWFVFRRWVSPYVEHKAVENIGAYVQYLRFLPKVLGVIGQWASQPVFQGMFLLILPVTVLLVLLNGRRCLAQWPFVYLLAHTLLAAAPCLIVNLAEPEWLDVYSIGRYLITFVGACSFLLAVLIVDLNRWKWSPRELWLLRCNRLSQYALVGLLVGAIGVYDVGLDLWPGHLKTAIFTSHPVGLVRQVIGEAHDMIGLSPAQREQLLNRRFKRAEFGPLTQVALQVTPETENVGLWLAPDNHDLYLPFKCQYLLYPRKVFILRTAQELTPTALRASAIGTVIAYGRDLASSDGPGGQAVYQFSPQYAVTRVQPSETSARQTAGYVAAPVQFASGLRLRGYLVAGPLLNNEAIVVLHWQNTQPLTQSYTVFVHLYAGNEFVAQNDSIPVLGLWPTFDWPLNSQVVDAHALILPPGRPESLRFCVGAYTSVNQERLKIEEASDYDVTDDVACHSLLPAAQ